MRTRRVRGGLLAVILVGAMLWPTLASAQGIGASLEDMAIEVDLDIYSKYVFRGLNTVDDFVLQPTVDLSLDGFAFNFWGNLDLTDENDNAFEFTEVDLTGSYAFSLDMFDFRLGLAAYLFPSESDEDTMEVFGSVGLDVLFSPTLTVYQDFDEADGTYAALSGSYTLEDPFDLGESVGLSPEFTISLGFGSGDHNDYYYGDSDAGIADLTLGLRVPYRLGETVTLAASIHYSALLDHDIRDKVDHEDNFWFGLSLVVTF